MAIIEEKLAGQVKENQIIHCSGEDIIICSKYKRPRPDSFDSVDRICSRDMRIKLGPCGVNGLFQIKGIELKDNAGKYPDDDFSGSGKSLLFDSNTDFVGPYYVRALNDGVEGRGTKFTGGWHGSSGGGTGNPTGRTIDIKASADEKPLKPDVQSTYCQRVDILVRNVIQGYNTTFQELDSLGDNRYILRELIKYTVIDGLIDINATITALEDLVIERYYGLQTINTAYSGSVYYGKGDNSVKKSSFEKNNSGTKLSYPDVDKIYLQSPDGGHTCTAWLDRNAGLGKLDSLEPSKSVAFTESYGKSYFNLVNGIPKKLSSGESAVWHGGYIFAPGKSSV